MELYVSALKHIASRCNFRDICDGLIRDRLIHGIRNDKLRDELLRDADLTLETAENRCRIAEMTDAHIKVLELVKLMLPVCLIKSLLVFLKCLIPS